ncbi:extracellular catalytic domain type 2 short-chain-length polyhydroxyalkanoate depolymerase [Aromatoleum toluclasticum]|uniref:extracellular catalytic domain type 2 short-chain-length polyhydroxyalkanoate depolymerase n=1 Tax=Aromatoleum toluclasticum TaxID=92003 RepID=UPI0003A4EA95|nr:poly(3-hydroxybutyrate) depolymerase [Aromatoleum toluclasticum]
MTRPFRSTAGLLAGLALATLAGTVPAADPPALPALGASLAQLTVSGVSSGGYMAVQFQVAHSALVTGAGILAAGPYECATGSMWRALNNCMAPGAGARAPGAEQTLARVREEAESHSIDPPAGLRDDRVWVFSGGADHTVERPVVDALLDFYRRVLPGDAIRFVEVGEAGHAMMSVADPQPNACPSSEPPFINRCGDLDAAGELLEHLIGPLAPRSTPPAGEMLAFDQRPFTGAAPIELSLADRGYVYVPPACHEGGCRVHVAFHGCRQGEAQVGRRFVDGAGYNEWADSNRLIVLYPQVRPRSGFAWGSLRWVYNPKGCWDWWGYADPDYATRNGGQIKAVRAMLERLAAPLPPPRPER